MDHERLRDLVSTLLDGELSPGERTEALAHLGACSECREWSRRWARIAAAIPRPVPPGPAAAEAFVSRVMSRLGPEEAAPVPVGRCWEWLGARWMIPALSAGMAALFLSILWPAPDWVGPVDSLLLLRSNDRAVARLVLPPDPGGPDGLLGFLAEER